MAEMDMTNIIQFTPRKDLSAQRNLEEFIATARDHIPAWGDLKGFTWDGARWPIPHGSIGFTNEENAKFKGKAIPSAKQLLHPAFMEVAKAYLRHRHHTKPNKNVSRGGA
jgi:hypothetical protein